MSKSDITILNVGARIVNTYIYPIQDGYVMIDTGYDKSLKNVYSRLKNKNIAPEKIKYIFLTHAHDDHAGFLNEFISKYPNIQVIISSKSKKVLIKGQNSFEGGCSSKLALFFCNIMKLLGRGEHRFPPIEEKNFDKFIEITNENKENIEKLLKGKIYYTEGHTKDSISLMINNEILFCGDAAMNGLPSLNKITIWIENKEEFINTWKRLIQLQPKKIYPGHGKPFDYTKLKDNIEKLEKVKLYKLKQRI